MENTNAQEYLIQAGGLMGLQKYQEALAILEKAETEDRFNMDVYLSKGIAYANLEDFEKARTEFEKALKIDKKEGIVYFHLGNIEMLQGHKAKGFEYYNNAMAYGYDDAQLFFSLGLMHEEDGEDDLALRNYTKAILKDPRRADIRINKARLLIKNNHYPEALQTLDELRLSNPDVFEAYHLKFFVLLELNKLEEAEQVIREAISLFPQDTGFALDKASLLIAKQEYDKALAYISGIEHTMEVDPEVLHSIEMTKARVYVSMQDVNKTIDALEKAKGIYASMEPAVFDDEAAYLLMNCYVSAENYEKVIECAQDLKKAESEEEAYYALAAYYYEPLALKHLGRREESQKLFKESVSHYRSLSLADPGNIDTYTFRIMSLRELGDYAKALELADYLIMVKEDVSEFHILRAAVLTDLGRDDEAKEENNIAQSLGGILTNLPDFKL
ncbi:MAG: tetratricopeptide repeat protein [Peptococcaceae bacterium]|nr:tetratricopeptide repeat protein [Peptococcaceae bacterium]